MRAEGCAKRPAATRTRARMNEEALPFIRGYLMFPVQLIAQSSHSSNANFPAGVSRHLPVDFRFDFAVDLWSRAARNMVHC